MAVRSTSAAVFQQLLHSGGLQQLQVDVLMFFLSKVNDTDYINYGLSQADVEDHFKDTTRSYGRRCGNLKDMGILYELLLPKPSSKTGNDVISYKLCDTFDDTKLKCRSTILRNLNEVQILFVGRLLTADVTQLVNVCVDCALPHKNWSRPALVDAILRATGQIHVRQSLAREGLARRTWLKQAEGGYG